MVVASMLAALSALAVGAPLLVSWATGSLAIPHNDAWAYSRIAETFGSTGHIHLVGWNRPFLVGQVVPLGPLGRSVTAQHVLVAALAVVGLVATYVLLMPRVGRKGAIFGDCERRRLARFRVAGSR